MKQVSQDMYDKLYYTQSCDGYAADGRLPPRIVSLLKYLGDSKNIIDIGCGRGEIAKSLSDRFVVSLDYSLASMELFYQNNTTDKPYVRHDMAQGIGWLTSNYFDCVILADIIEHVYDDVLSVLATESVRLLKTGGLLLIDTPIKTRGSPHHVNIKNSVTDVVTMFPGTVLVTSEWFKEPEHCHIIVRKV
jgi:2-polyprenyl-3-methyl-5-hydroxy-6-metoxy-1,4-benzoquinol methylase